MMTTHDQGFTLPELFVSIAIIAVLLGASMVLLRPANVSTQLNNSLRRTGLARTVIALNKYVGTVGGLPPNISTKETGIGSLSGEYNLCAYLVPAYAQDLPSDPAFGFKAVGTTATQASCNQKGVVYSTGYTIKMAANGHVEVSAPFATGGAITLQGPASKS